MTTKPIAVWCVVSPEGDPCIQNLSVDEQDAIGQWLYMQCADNQWPHFEGLGWQCKRFILSEAEGGQ